MSFIKHAIISAAGMGSRVGLNMPKCLIKFNGTSIIEHQLDLLKDIEDVRIVVGFMEESVVSHVKSIRNDVVFVRNPDYQNTSNTYSINLATSDLKSPYILMDGDLLINQKSFSRFISSFNGKDTLVGMTKANTDDAVYVELNDKDEVVGFDRKKKSEYEWCGIVCLNNIKVTSEYSYLYQLMNKYLPLKAKDIECSEIDTPDDLKRAQNLLSRYFT